jgi:uncharacterized SAM-binding protein YcdF (DUF218 family)
LTAGTERDERTRTGRHLARQLMAGLLVLIAASTAFAARSFIWPTSDTAFPDGPIVVLGGGGGERLTTALGLRGEGEQRELVVSASAIDEWRAAGGRCTPEEITCMVPDPVSTYGEATTVRDLVAANGWTHVTVVTSDFHVTRTRLLFDRCLDEPVRVVAAPTDPNVIERTYRIVREMTATVVARVRGSCG